MNTTENSFIKGLSPHAISLFKRDFEKLRPLLVLHATRPEIEEAEVDEAAMEKRKAQSKKDYVDGGWEVSQVKAMKGCFFPVITGTSSATGTLPEVKVEITDSHANKGKIILSDSFGNEFAQEWDAFITQAAGVENPFGGDGYLMLWACPQSLFSKPYMAMSTQLGERGFKNIVPYLMFTINTKDNVPMAAIGPKTAASGNVDSVLTAHEIPQVTESHVMGSYLVGLSKFKKNLQAMKEGLLGNQEDSAEKTLLLTRLEALMGILGVLEASGPGTVVQETKHKDIPEEVAKEFRSFSAAVDKFQSSPSFVSGSTVLQ